MAIFYFMRLKNGLDSKKVRIECVPDLAFLPFSPPKNSLTPKMKLFIQERDILIRFEEHYLKNKTTYDHQWIRTREVMKSIASDMSIYRTRYLLLKLEESGYITGMIARGTQGLCWKLTLEYQIKLSNGFSFKLKKNCLLEK